MTASTLPPAYAAVEELRQFQSFPPGQEQDDVDLQRALDAGKAWIDWFTGRSFGTLLNETREYAAIAPDVVEVLDLQPTAPAIAVDEAGDRTFTLTLTPEQYALEPASGPPFDTVRMWPTPSGGATPVSLCDGQLVRITGAWGYTDARGRVPAPVAQANLLLGARWFTRREAPFQVLQSGELGAFERVPRVDDDVHSLLFPLCRPGSPGYQLLVSQLPPGAAAGGSNWVMV